MSSSKSKTGYSQTALRKKSEVLDVLRSLIFPQALSRMEPKLNEKPFKLEHVIKTAYSLLHRRARQLDVGSELESWTWSLSIPGKLNFNVRFGEHAIQGTVEPFVSNDVGHGTHLAVSFTMTSPRPRRGTHLKVVRPEISYHCSDYRRRNSNLDVRVQFDTHAAAVLKEPTSKSVETAIAPDSQTVLYPSEK
ncbi:hypothetical protein TNCV_4809491 [Trichonephila clavipes]|nr:hypothetical protein TNCV_4809491 [Trichonephila clavipes]